MVTTEGYMFFPPLVESDEETQKLKKFNHHSFFGNPCFHWISGHGNKFLVLFAKDLIVNCLTLQTHTSKTATARTRYLPFHTNPLIPYEQNLSMSYA
jgi:hypothetical protein